MLVKKTKVPTHLAHKPIYAINDYAKIDGYYKDYDTDAVGISLGRAQWDSTQVIPGVKVWRHNNKWSRQSEETTLTRALDMATLTVKVLDNHYNGTELDSIDFTNHGAVEIENIPCKPEIKAELLDFLDKNKNDFDEHIKVLYQALQSYMKNLK